MQIREARAQYFQTAGFAPDGGYNDKWVKLKLGRAFISFPNTAARVRSVKLHDIHHVLTGYLTNWTGESEIGAWEIASGCGRHYPAWVLNFGAFVIGLIIAPRRVYQAFIRGRHSRNLYDGEFRDSLLEREVDDLRKELQIPATSVASVADRLAFVFWAAVAVIVSVAPYVAAAAILAWVL